MSASEKLKALEGSLTDYDAFVRALPQIVAVVEAAEHEAAVTDDATTHASLSAALAALEDALS